MSPEAQQEAIAKLRPQPQKSFNEPAVHEPWHEMPSMFLFCDQDQALPLVVQEKNCQEPGEPSDLPRRWISFCLLERPRAGHRWVGACFERGSTAKRYSCELDWALYHRKLATFISPAGFPNHIGQLIPLPEYVTGTGGNFHGGFRRV